MGDRLAQPRETIARRPSARAAWVITWARVLRRAHAAEAEVDGWVSGLEKHLELGGEGTIIGQDPGADLEHGRVRGVGPGARVGSAASQGRPVRT